MRAPNVNAIINASMLEGIAGRQLEGASFPVAYDLAPGTFAAVDFGRNIAELAHTRNLTLQLKSRGDAMVATGTLAAHRHAMEWKQVAGIRSLASTAFA